MRRYIITGASSDIGTAYLGELERSGEDAVAYCQYFSDCARLDEMRNEFRRVRIRTFQCDLSSAEQTDRWIGDMSEEGFVPTHMLHLAAGKLGYMRLRQFDWDKTVSGLTIQVNSIAQLLKAFLPKMAREKYGRVAVLVSSCTIGAPPKFMADYLIAKHALLGLVKGAAIEYAGTGIAINGLSPGMIETKFLSEIDPRVPEMAAQSCPMKRNAKMDEVVSALTYLLSDEAGYLNGINLNMTGGELM